MMALSDEELKAKTQEYKDRYARGRRWIPFCLRRMLLYGRAARRVLNMEHFRVQIIGGIILHQGRIAEMKTGEGKTLVSPRFRLT